MRFLIFALKENIFLLQNLIDFQQREEEINYAENE